MESVLESTTLDNLDMGLSFGDDSQKVEKMNQSFLLLKKKLLRSHDLLGQYSTKIQECERLRADLDACQRDSERFKQQHLTTTAKVIKLSMDKTKLEEINKQLETRLSDQGIQMAGDQRLIQQLGCKLEEIEIRNSERIMELDLEKAGLQTKVKDLEQDMRRLTKTHETELKKLQRKLEATPVKKGPANKKLKSPPQSKISLGDIDSEETEISELPEISLGTPKNLSSPKKSPKSPKISKISEDEELPALNSPIKIVEPEVKQFSDVGVNVDFGGKFELEKAVMLDKNVMTDEFYSIKDNPYPIFCAKCEEFIEMPEEAISKAIRLPPRIADLAPSPRVRRVVRESSERKECGPIVLDSLQRRVKLLEKRLKRKANVENQQTCCGHSTNHCGGNNSLGQTSQFDIMTEFFSRMMRLPGNRTVTRRESTRSRKVSIKTKRKTRHKRSIVLDSRRSRHDWDVVSESSDPNPDPDPDLEDFSRSSNRFGKSRRQFPEKDLDPRVPRIRCQNSGFRSPTPEPEIDRPSRYQKSKKRKQSRSHASLFRSPTPEPEPDQHTHDKKSQNQRQSRSQNPGFRSPTPEPEPDQPGHCQKSQKRKQSRARTSGFRSPTPEPEPDESQDYQSFPQRTNESSSKLPDSRSPTPEPETIETPSTSQKRKHTSNSTIDEVIAKRRRKTDDSKPANTRSNLLKNLKRLKKDNSAVKTIAALITKNQSTENTAVSGGSSTPGEMKFKKRIAHIPRKCEQDLKTSESFSKPEEVPPPVTIREKILTRSLTKPEDTSDSSKSEDVDVQGDSLTVENDEPEVARAESPSKCSGKSEEEMIIDEARAPINEAADQELRDKSAEIGKSEILPSDTEELPASEDIGSSSTADVIKDLRNRQIHVSPMKAKSVSPEKPICPVNLEFKRFSSENLLQSSKVEPVEGMEAIDDIGAFEKMEIDQNEEPEDPAPVDKIEKIEVLLDQYLAMSKKPRGRPPKTLDIAKGLQANAEKLIKEELKTLTDCADWEDNVHSRVCEKILSVKSPRTVAKAVIDFLVDRSTTHEPLDMTFTPPAPPMSKSLQKIVAVLRFLEMTMPDLVEFVFKGIQYTLFKLNANPPWDAVEELSRLFTVLARMKKDRDRVRIMCCDAVYVLQRKSQIVLHAVLTCWPEVLPMYDASKDQHLPITILHASKWPTEQNSKVEQLKRLIKGFFNYPQNDPSEVYVKKLLDILSNDHNKYVATALLLIAKKEGPDWAYRHVIQGGLMPMIVGGKSPSIYHALKLLGFLMRPFPVADTDGSVKKIVEQLRALAEATAGPAELQEGAISALLSLSRHRFDEVANTVLAWQPSSNVDEFLREQLHALFAARNSSLWSQIKAKNRGNL